MTPDDLARSCIHALTDPRRSMLGEEPVVDIAGSRKAPLPKKSFPRWKHIVNGADGKPVYYYPAKQLLSALAYHGMIDISDYYQEPATV